MDEKKKVREFCGICERARICIHGFFLLLMSSQNTKDAISAFMIGSKESQHPSFTEDFGVSPRVDGVYEYALVSFHTKKFQEKIHRDLSRI